MPIAPPSSYPVSEMAEAAPARAGGAAVRMTSFVSVSAKPIPSPSSTEMTANTASGVPARSWVPSAYPAAARISPKATTTRTGTRRANAGEASEPITVANASGSSHAPARAGLMPRTSCRYWGRKKAAPTMANTEATLVSTAGENPGSANRPTSIIGWASLRCRRTNSHRIPAPASAMSPVPMPGSRAAALRA